MRKLAGFPQQAMILGCSPHVKLRKDMSASAIDYYCCGAYHRIGSDGVAQGDSFSGILSLVFIHFPFSWSVLLKI